MSQLRKDIADLEENGQLGDWCFYNNDADMFLNYPIKSIYAGEPDNIDIVHLYIHRAGTVFERSPSWEWDGNRDAPTLSPSINVINRWHGYLRAGKLETV
jgi:hypothetical protein